MPLANPSHSRAVDHNRSSSPFARLSPICSGFTVGGGCGCGGGCGGGELCCGSSGRVRAEITRPRHAVIAGRVHPQLLMSTAHTPNPRKRRRRRGIPPPPPPPPLPSSLYQHHYHKPPKAARILGSVDQLKEEVEVVAVRRKRKEEKGKSDKKSCQQQQQRALPRQIFIVARAYQKRQNRRNSRLTKRNLEAAADEEAGLAGRWREGNWSNHVRNGKLVKDLRHSKHSRWRDVSAIQKPEPVQIQPTPTPTPTPTPESVQIQPTPTPEPEPPTQSSLRPLSLNVRELVGKGFQQARKFGTSDTVTHAMVPVRQGYRIKRLAEDQVSTHAVIETASPPMCEISEAPPHAAEIALGVARTSSGRYSHPASTSKIERITGAQLSNDLYEYRVSGQPDVKHRTSRSLDRRGKSLSYPVFSPVSFDTDVSSSGREFEFSPTSSSVDAMLTELTPPPPPPPIAAEYPHIEALTRANIAFKRRIPSRSDKSSSIPSSISSSSPTRPSPANRKSAIHIASMFSEDRFEDHTIQISSTTSLTPPFSTAIRGFTSIQSEVSVTASSISTFQFGAMEEFDTHLPIPPPEPAARPPSRHSWSGRSVLFLDSEASDAPLDLPKSHLVTLHQPSSVAQARVSATGSSFLTVPGRFPDTNSAIGHHHLHHHPLTIIPTATSTSSTSSVESINTINGRGGLSPTPAIRIHETRDPVFLNEEGESSASAGAAVRE